MTVEKKNTDAMSVVGETRRKVIKGAAWTAPVVMATSLPQHAQASEVTTTTTEGLVTVSYDFGPEGNLGALTWMVDGMEVTIPNGDLDAYAAAMSQLSGFTWVVVDGMVQAIMTAAEAEAFAEAIDKPGTEYPPTVG